MKLLRYLWTRRDGQCAFRRRAARAQSPEELIALAVAFVATAADSPAAMGQRAAEAAAALGPGSAPLLAATLGAPPRQPAAAIPRYAGLGSWAAACDLAVFELLGRLGAAALPTLRAILAGNDDLAPHAITALSRLARAGIERAAIANDLADALPTLPVAALAAAIDDIAALLPCSPPLQAAFAAVVERHGRAGVNLMGMIAAAPDAATRPARQRPARRTRTTLTITQSILLGPAEEGLELAGE